jgi:hypothetical protein
MTIATFSGGTAFESGSCSNGGPENFSPSLTQTSRRETCSLFRRQGGRKRKERKKREIFRSSVLAMIIFISKTPEIGHRY